MLDSILKETLNRGCLEVDVSEQKHPEKYVNIIKKELGESYNILKSNYDSKERIYHIHFERRDKNA